MNVNFGLLAVNNNILKFRNLHVARKFTNN